MRKVLFVAINARFTHTNLALLYLNRLGRESSDSRIIEFTISEEPLSILKEISSFKPEIIAISVYIWNSRLVRELVPEIKKVIPSVKLVLGGPEVSYNPQTWLSRYQHIDYIISGGGEHAWQVLLESDFQYPEKVIKLLNCSLNEIPFPYEGFDLNNFKNRIIYYEASRGCPFQCSYCLSSLGSTSLEYRDIRKVLPELKCFIDQKVPLVKFVDRTFNSDTQFTRRIWDFLISHRKDTRFHFEINPLLISKEDITILKEVPEKLFQFEVGIQSTNEDTLKEINRSGNWQIIRDNVEMLLKETSIPIHLDLIFGLPHETFISSQRSFNEIYNLKPDHFQPGMLKVLPGTPMEERAVEYELEYQQEPPYRILSNKWITFSELFILQNMEHLVNNLYNSHRFTRSLAVMEQLMPSPFELYSELLAFWEKEKVNYWQKDWVKTATLLAHYLSKKFPEEYEFLLDALGWDLCSSSGLQYYPNLLLNDGIRELRYKWRRYLRENIDELCCVFEVNKNILHKGMVFKPGSDRFKEKYNLDDKACYLFLKGKDGFRKDIRFELSKLDMDV